MEESAPSKKHSLENQDSSQYLKARLTNNYQFQRAQQEVFNNMQSYSKMAAYSLNSNCQSIERCKLQQIKSLLSQFSKPNTVDVEISQKQFKKFMQNRVSQNMQQFQQLMRDGQSNDDNNEEDGSNENEEEYNEDYGSDQEDQQDDQQEDQSDEEMIHESLAKRHPYLQEPYTSDIDPNQITVAVFDRTIPKFMEVLLQPDFDHVKCRDALKTLNELVHHQETMDSMIDHNILQITSNLLKHSDWEVREQCALLLSSFAIARRARELFSNAFDKLKDLLEDKVLRVREAVALCFQKLSVNDDGCFRIVESGSAVSMIHSFIRHSKDAQSLKGEDGVYLIHLLEAFVNLTFSDNGIQPLLGQHAISTFNTIISEKYVSDILANEHKQKIQELCLRVLGNMSINHEGKQECIDDKVILNAWKYLDSPVYEKRLNSSLVLMSTTIHLNGKQQAVWYEEEVGQPKIIQKIIERLYEKQNGDLRKNLKVALINIAELPEGFLKITHELSDKMDLLDEVFGPRSVKALHNLLPKLTDYEDPLKIENIKIAQKYMRYIKSLAYIIKKYKEEAVQVAIDDTINFSEKLAPFLNPETQLQKETVLCLREVCSIDAYNCHILKKFILNYGEVPIKRENSGNITTFKRELSQYADLLELAFEAQILT